nr:MAG: hypothetical protein [Enquatrovirus sp.]
MLLKLTAQEAPINIYVQVENIVAFRPYINGTEIAVNSSDLHIYVRETPEELIEIWGVTVKGKTNE